MFQRITFLTQTLKLLSDEVSILPATGGAVEDLQHTDPDEVEDGLINRDNSEITEFLEIPKPSPSSLYFPTPPLYRTENHLFRYFIDGSIRTYYLATGIEGSRSFPIELAQIGAAVVTRDDDGKVGLLKVKTQILLLLPRGQYGVSDTVWNRLVRLNTPDGFFTVEDTTAKKAYLPDASVENLRNRAGAIARTRMHDLEIKLINETNNRRNDDSWLILDGGVRASGFVNLQAKNLIGVAKSFDKSPQFYLGSGRHNRKDITSILARLPYGYRTAAFSAFNGEVAFWYVRLRRQDEVDFPLKGVVKVLDSCDLKR